MNRPLARTALGIAVFLAGAAVSYRVFLREPCLTWGATDEEARRAMPGDELMPAPDIVATRAIAIDAPAEDVWPWLVQMGSGRGGAYTYDWVENLLGLDMRSADEILPQFQGLAVGDVLPMGDAGPSLRVEVLDPGRALVLRSEDGAWVWAFGLHARDGATRLVSRNRIALPGASAAKRLAYTLLMEPGSLLMERRMLVGIRQRAERVRGGRD